jgi:Kef-type K+ transport system membrane component KefB
MHPAYYLAALVGVQIIPRMLQRFPVPAPVWAVLLGVATGHFVPEFRNDAVLTQLGALGVASLFLFAGIEVRVAHMRADARPLAVYVVTRVLSLAALSAGIVLLPELSAGLSLPPPLASWIPAMPAFDPRSAVLIALAVLTPSTGFILGAIGTMGLDADEQRAVRLKAIAAEILALAVMFVVLGSTTLETLGWSTLALLALAIAIRLLFRGAARFLLPYAPGSEFSLVIVVALVAAYATHALGVHYFIGAFVVGVLVQYVRSDLPAASSWETIHAIELFSSFFMPYFFFNAGLGLPASALSVEALLIGLALSAVALPLRVLMVTLQRRLTLRERWHEGVRISVPLLPTLIFALVIAEVLRADFGLPDELYGALVVYAIVSTVVPSLVLRTAAARFDPANVAQVDSEAAGPQGKSGSAAAEPGSATSSRI